MNAWPANEPGHLLVGFAAERAFELFSALECDHDGSLCQDGLDNSEACAGVKADLTWLSGIRLIFRVAAINMVLRFYDIMVSDEDDRRNP
jgi:hypothetical protein